VAIGDVTYALNRLSTDDLALVFHRPAPLLPKSTKYRLGHKNVQTTLRYAEQSDATADAEVRAWRRAKRDT
jgi:hypothetical protein